MTGTKRHLPALIAAFLLAGCSGDLGIDGLTFACEKDSDCGEGGQCTPGKACVFPDGGKSSAGGSDASQPPDGGPHPADAGLDAGANAGKDAGPDTGFDTGGGDADTADSGEPGDTGSGDGGGVVLTWSSLYQAVTGSCSSANYRLNSITGWVALPAGNSQTNVLRPESPVKK